jgi:hypothetical protein
MVNRSLWSRVQQTTCQVTLVVCTTINAVMSLNHVMTQSLRNRQDSISKAHLTYLRCYSVLGPCKSGFRLHSLSS